MKKHSALCLAVLFFLLTFVESAYAQTLIASDFTKTTARNTTLFFSSQDFIANSNPTSGKSLVSVTFNQVPSADAGELKLDGSSLKKESTVETDALNRLTFVPLAGYQGEAIFTWTANYGGGTRSPYPGAVVITVGQSPSPQLSPKEPQISENTTEKESKMQSNTSKKSSNYDTIKPLQYQDMLSHWAAYSAGQLAARGYIVGEEYGNCFYFRPDVPITRFEFLLMINSVFKIDPKDSLADNPFSDDGADAYQLRAGIAAYEKGIFDGVVADDGKRYLYPDHSLTKIEAVSILNRALALESYGVGQSEFTDKEQIPDWAMQAVRNLEAYGILQGDEHNCLHPNETLTRAQSAELVWQVFKLLEHKNENKAVYNTVFCGD